MTVVVVVAVFFVIIVHKTVGYLLFNTMISAIYLDIYIYTLFKHSH